MKKILFILLLFVSVCISVHAEDSICSHLYSEVVCNSNNGTIEYAVNLRYIHDGQASFYAPPDSVKVDSLHILFETQKWQYDIVLTLIGPLPVHDRVDIKNIENPQKGYYAIELFLGDCKTTSVYYMRRTNWSTAIEEPSAEALQDRTYKYIRNGQVLIHRGDADYDLTGRKMELRE